MSDVKIFSCHGVAVYVARLDVVARCERRQAERRAVRRLVEAAFGSDARLEHRLDGAPYVAGRPEHISISHGAGLAMMAVDARRPIGIDVECMREQLRRVAARVIDEEDMRAYGATDRGLLFAWTAKEAIFKAAGIEGLTIGEIRLPGAVGNRRFDVVHFCRGEVAVALAREHFLEE